MKKKKWCLLSPLHTFFINHTNVCGTAEPISSLLRDCTFMGYWKWSFSLLKEVEFHIWWKFDKEIQKLQHRVKKKKTKTWAGCAWCHSHAWMQNWSCSKFPNERNKPPYPRASFHFFFFSGFPSLLSVTTSGRKSRYFHRLLSTVLCYRTAAVPPSAALAAL